MILTSDAPCLIFLLLLLPRTTDRLACEFIGMQFWGQKTDASLSGPTSSGGGNAILLEFQEKVLFCLVSPAS